MQIGQSSRKGIFMNIYNCSSGNCYIVSDNDNCEKPKKDKCKCCEKCNQCDDCHCIEQPCVVCKGKDSCKCKDDCVCCEKKPHKPNKKKEED